MGKTTFTVAPDISQKLLAAFGRADIDPTRDFLTVGTLREAPKEGISVSHASPK